MAHAKKSPSASKRWMSCPGSINAIQALDEALRDVASIYAMEGTAAHELGERCLNNSMMPENYLGETITVEDGGLVQEFEVTQNMVDAVTIYVNYVNSIVKAYKDAEMLLEQEFHLDILDPDIWGTSDCSIFSREALTLHVIDYKHGQGVSVEVDYNSQMLVYALGALSELYKNGKVDWREMDDLKVRITIVQPRDGHPEGAIREWEVSAKWLRAWGVMTLQPAARATEDPNAVRHAGDHCLFCPAKATCYAVIERTAALAATAFRQPVVPDPKDLTPEQFQQVMEFSDIIFGWVQAVKDYAQHLLQSGQEVPGFKLVQRKSNRVWADQKTAETLLDLHLGDAAYTKKLISVAQAEQKLKARNKELDASYWVKPDTGLVMAPDSDRRAAVEAPAKQFDVVLSDTARALLS